jgi:CDP-glucose 4,6-dehydratase
LVRASYSDPVQTYSTNVMGTVHLLEAVRQSPGVRAVVIVTTDKCYENKEWVWGYREDEPMGGHDPYSSSKACSELVTSAYRRSYFFQGTTQSQPVALASARAGNVIGGGDYAPDRLLPDILAAFSKGESVAVRCPHATRPWQHVLEPLRGYLTLAELLYLEGLDRAQAWNFGPRHEDVKPVQWIVERLAILWGDGARWHLDKEDHPHEAHYLRLDTSKAADQLRWKPELSLSTALEWVVQWHREVSTGASARDVTLCQIHAYSSLAFEDKNEPHRA